MSKDELTWDRGSLDSLPVLMPSVEVIVSELLLENSARATDTVGALDRRKVDELMQVVFLTHPHRGWQWRGTNDLRMVNIYKTEDSIWAPEAQPPTGGRKKEHKALWDAR
jgi:hypothetical protein